MPREPIPQTQIIEALRTTHQDIKVEADRSWLWVIEPDLAPLHKKCTCPQCAERAEKREAIKALGFRFAFKPHALPSGKTSRWGHSCTMPTPFRRRGGKAKQADEPLDAELAEGVEFFEQL